MLGVQFVGRRFGFNRVAAGHAALDRDDARMGGSQAVRVVDEGQGREPLALEFQVQGGVRLGSASGPALRFMAMPYALDALDL